MANDSTGYSGDHQNQPTKEEKEKHWYDIDDKRKKQLEVRSRHLSL